MSDMGHKAKNDVGPVILQEQSVRETNAQTPEQMHNLELSAKCEQ